MTSRKRNLSIIGLVLVLLAAAVAIIATKPTVLGLDLRGGVELVYEGRPTPQAPKITDQTLNDAIETIRKRTDALGVSEPEIQKAGSNQISIGLPNVSNADRAIDQVGTTAQLQFYDWEPNVLSEGDRGPNAPFSGTSALFDAVSLASKSKPKAEQTDLPPGNPQNLTPQQADRRNDTSRAKYYLFGPDKKLISGPDANCRELLQDYEPATGTPRSAADVPKASKCESELRSVPIGTAKANAKGDPPSGKSGPPAKSQVLEVPQGLVVIQAEQQPKQPDSVKNYYALEDDSELSGTDIKNPEVSQDQSSGNAVSMQFTKRGRQSFARATKREAERGSEVVLPPGATSDQRDATLQRFAITLDNRIVSLATIDYRKNPEGIDGRTGAEITGLNTPQEAQDLAESLRIGALPIELKLVSQTTVSATLGQQALHQGLIAGGVGLALTVLFLLLFYRVLGGVAAVALVIYAVLLFGLVKLIPITLTLPGIAGLILTLGVAADANIVIFERIKEEAREGRSIPAAISAGYAKALRTIVDANVVTIGVAFVLFTIASAGIKGFAFTLGIGTIVSLFTAVLATSAILGAMARTRLIGSRFAIGATGREHGEGKVGSHFDFVGRSKWFFSASGLILVVGALSIAGLGLKFGIDFESGTRIKTPIERTANVDQVRDVLTPLGYGDAKIQKVDEPDLGRNVFQISTATLEPSEVQKVRRALDERFGAPQQTFDASSIGPTFGAQIAKTALYAVLFSLLLISIYIALRFELKFAVPVLIALSHDILITAGVYAIFGREVTTSTVAALLTILGYSLYDTIIVFDRIRENVPRMPRATFSQIVNRSMSEVIVRSLVTSASTLLPVVALMVFGGETLRDFAFALLVGVASGAYSSIFIAAPVLTLWKEREPTYVRRRLNQLREFGGTVPAFASGVISSPDDEQGGASAKRGRGKGRSQAPAQQPVAATGSAPQPATAGGAPVPTSPEPAAPRTAGSSTEVVSTDGGGDDALEDAKARRARNRARKKHGRR